MKPIEVEAYQYTENNLLFLNQWTAYRIEDIEGRLCFHENEMMSVIINKNDWIVKYKDQFEVYPNEAFIDLYEKV